MKYLNSLKNIIKNDTVQIDLPEEEPKFTLIFYLFNISKFLSLKILFLFFSGKAYSFDFCSSWSRI
jgi:hypothetical protein